ncbi:hypothetical protein PR202_gb16422 [Eleusine coracana subsp. coracana]|uniref:Uncharacterized protein n=1 Tax=Eleusine coracana subsp. coracana TaxID=191504 RepID=A0AAV5F0T5_ELECO|nr:hypothetical protein PR202_gb16422 [Eleusine coracana subsp. coracana]
MPVLRWSWTMVVSWTNIIVMTTSLMVIIIVISPILIISSTMVVAVLPWRRILPILSSVVPSVVPAVVSWRRILAVLSLVVPSVVHPPIAAFFLIASVIPSVFFIMRVDGVSSITDIETISQIFTPMPTS